jgi:pimeloyl-ACP methyl ester carboxylesterase
MSNVLELTVRVNDSGGPLAAVVSGDVAAINGHNRVLLLVHGYNVNLAYARQEYGIFAGHAAANYIGTPAGFFWPGDLPNRVFSTLSYPNQIQPAITSAAHLADLLATFHGAQNGPMQIDLVGHSLGCRVILELLAHWAGGLPPQVRVGRVVLMAAAVLVHHVDSGGQLRTAAHLPQAVTVLTSRGDTVLEFAFPLGETVAGETSFPEAVGRNGNPPNTWASQQAMAESSGKAYEHGSYFEGIESANATALALGVAASRATPVNVIPTAALPAARTIGARLLRPR